MATPFSFRPVRVFISSPGDLFAERDVIKRVLDKLDDMLQYKSRFKFIPYAYEDSVPAQVGESAQIVVDRYLIEPHQVDIFICMMWHRMGTPTKDQVNPDTGLPYQSGTEYEFLSAYRAYRDTKRAPLVLLYRCTRSTTDQDNFDSDQNERVKSFFKRFNPSGDLKGLYRKFDSIETLADIVRNDLIELIEKPGNLLNEPLTFSVTTSSRKPVELLPKNKPSDYIERLAVLDTLRGALLGNYSTIGIVALHGQGGIGKTVLARAICDDLTIRTQFADGILWATLGATPDVLAEQRKWIVELGGDLSRSTSPDNAKAELMRLLKDRSLLLIIDDVWNAADADFLNAGGANCRVLLTTRQKQNVPDAAILSLEEMNKSEAKALLAKASDTIHPESDSIVARLGYLPQAIKIVGAMLRDGLSWSDIREALNKNDAEAVEYNGNSVISATKASVDVLPPEHRTRYHELIVFPDDEPLNAEAVIRLWAKTANLKKLRAQNLLNDLKGRGLIETAGTLHDLQLDYLRWVWSEKPAEVTALHGLLVDAYDDLLADANGDIESDRLGGNDYGWRWVAYHLKEAKRGESLRNLLTDGRYLVGKIARLGTAALVAECAWLHNDTALQILCSALELSAHVLDKENGTREFLSQITGRLGKQHGLHNVPQSTRPYLYLTSRSLTTPKSGLKRILRGHTSWVNSVVSSPNDHFILTASKDNTVRVWDTVTGAELYRLAGHTASVNNATYCSNERFIVTASNDATARVWNAASGQELYILTGHTAPVNSAAFSMDGHFIVTASDDHSIRIWDVASGVLLRTLMGHTASVKSAVFSVNGRFVLTAAVDNTARIWDSATGIEVRVLIGHTASVNTAMFSPDEHLILTASDDKTARVWDATTGIELYRLEGHTKWVSNAVFSPDSRFILTASGDKTSRVWDITTRSELQKLAGHTAVVNSAAFTGDGRFILTASADHTTRIWDVSTTNKLYLNTEHTNWVNSVTYSTDGRFILTAASDNSVRIWDATAEIELNVLIGHTDWVRSAVFSMDGHYILTASDDKTACVWDAVTGSQLLRLTGHYDSVNSAVYSPDRRFILTASKDKTARVWDAITGIELDKLTGHMQSVKTAVYSPDGRFILTASSDKTVRIWDAATKAELHTLIGHSASIRSAIYSSDGQYILTSSYDRTARIWDAITAAEVFVIEGHSAELNSAIYSSDGQYIFTASYDNTVRVWDINTRQEKCRFTADSVVTCIAANLKTNTQIVVGDASGQVHWLQLII